MIDSPTYENSHDFRQRYLRSYGFLIREDRKHLVYITECGVDQVKFSDISGASLFCQSNRGIKFEFIPVTRGWFYTSQGMCYLSRVPEKQYTRGISPNNTQVLVYSYGDGLTKSSVSFDLLNDIFVDPPEPPTLEEYLEDKSKIFKVSKHFVFLNNKVYFFEREIGTVTRSYKTISLKEPMFKQELKDALVKNNLPFEVV